MKPTTEAPPSLSTPRPHRADWSLLYVSIAWALALVVFATDNTGRFIELGFTTVNTGMWMSLIVVLPALILIGFAVLSSLDANRLVSATSTILAVVPWAVVSCIALLSIGYATDESPAAVPSAGFADRVHAWGWLTFSFAFPGLTYFCLSWMDRLASSPVTRWAVGWATAAIPAVALDAFAAYTKFA